MGFSISINEKGGPQKQLEFDKAEVTIGRVQGNDVVLPKGNISKRHSRIVLKDGKFIIIDMQSTNGTYVNGKKITTPQVIKATDKIYIGDFTLQLLARADNGEGEDADAFAEVAAEAAQKRPAGLIDDNFDKEFDNAPEEPKKKKSVAPRVDSEPAGLQLELGDPEPEDDAELDLGGGPASEPPRRPTPAPAPVAPSARAKPKSSSAGSVAPAKPKSVAPPPKLKSGVSSIRPESSEAPLSLARDETALPAGPSPQSAAAFAPAGAPVVVAAAAAPALERREAQLRLHQILVDELDLRASLPAELAGRRAEALRLANDRAADLMPSMTIEDREALAEDAALSAMDLGPLGPLVGDAGVHEISVNQLRQIFVDREGALEDAGVSFATEAELVRAARALAVLGGHAPASVPSLIDVRLRDGARVVSALPPLAFRGPSLSYRKSTRECYSLEDLVTNQTLDRPMITMLEYCIRYRQGILLAVGPGAGATATLNALGSLVPAEERIVTVERGVELHLPHTHVTTLDPGAAELGEVVRHAVSLQPDRAIIGLMSGSSAFDVLSALAGPLEGSIVAYSAESPEQAIDRLARVDVADRASSLAEARKLVAGAIQIVVQEERHSDGRRRITKISELHVEGDNVALEDIFVFEAGGTDENGVITGTFRATGVTPQFVVDLSDQVDASIFES